MKNPCRFNQPKVLKEIGTQLLTELFDRFKEPLDGGNIPMPNPNLEEEDYFKTVAELFKSPENLPQDLREAVLAVEELADPANKERLEEAFWASPYELYIEPQASPEHTALRIWLHAPYGRAQAKEPGAPLSPPNGVPVGERAEEVVPSGPTSVDAESASTQLGGGEGEAVLEEVNEAAPQKEASRPPTYIRRRTGKIACLPKETRERINEMISDGFTYARIIKELGEEGRALNQINLSNWAKGGYKDWLEEQKDREETGLWEEYTLDLVKQNEISALEEANIKMATVQIRKALRAIGHASLQTSLQANPDSYIRLLNALSRLTAGAIKCREERAKAEQRQADAQRQKADPDSLCVTAETLQKIERLLRLR